MDRPPRPGRLRPTGSGHPNALASALGALLLALVALPLAASPAAAAWQSYAADCPVNVRTATTLSSKVLQVIPTGATVTTSNELSGDSWTADCIGSESGHRWFAIVKINGVAVSSLFGVSPVYAAKGLFHAVGVLEGVDVSRWQGAIDFAKVKASGRSFVIAKASEGIGYTDPKWATNRAAAAAAGMFVGGYHFARPDLNPTNPRGEADWFASQLALAPGMLVPALDLENSGGLSVSALTAWVQAWLDEVTLKTGTRPMIYVSPSFWSTKLGDTTKFADEGYTVLWVAHWFVNGPNVPAKNWGGHGWTFWQYDDCGTVPGIGGCVDLDRFNGLDMTRVTAAADFALAASPGSQSVEQGAPATVAVNLDRSFFTLPINVSISGLPQGVSASVAPSSVTGATASIALTTTASGATVTPVGTYPLTVTATANGVSKTSTATLSVTDGLPPTVLAPRPWLFGPVMVGAAISSRLTWSASDPSGVASLGLQRQVDGGAWTPVGVGPKDVTWIDSLPFGHTVRERLMATDAIGNASGWATGPAVEAFLVQQNSSLVRYGGTWHTFSTSSALGGSLKYTSVRGAWASYSFTGAAISLVADRGPKRGSAAVYVDGSYRGRINLWSAGYQGRQVVFALNWTANGSHTIKLVCLGTSGHPVIDLDALVRVVRS